MLQMRCIVWLMVFSTTYAEFCSGEYQLTNGCDISGSVLETGQNCRSIADCSGRCNGNEKCLSIKYDAVNRVCQLMSERYPPLGTTCATMMLYAQLTYSSCRQSINKVCTTSADCLVRNSQCFHGLCRCDPGYSYLYTNESCVTSCDVYGSTFTLHNGHKIYGHNDGVLTDIDTVEECEQACVQETGFVCLTVDYWPDLRKCFLSAATALSSPPDYMADTSIDHYHRNCGIL